MSSDGRQRSRSRSRERDGEVSAQPITSNYPPQTQYSSYGNAPGFNAGIPSLQVPAFAIASVSSAGNINPIIEVECSTESSGLFF